MNEELLEINVGIISHAGLAKSMYLDAVELAKEKKFVEADAKYKEAREEYLIAHRMHSSLLQRFASGEKLELDIMLVHAQNHLSSAEMVSYLAKEVIRLEKEK